MCIKAHSKQGCSVRGLIKNSGSQTFTNFYEREKCRSGFGQSSTNFQRFSRTLQHVSVKMTVTVTWQQPLPIQSHSFLAVKMTCLMIYIWNMICNLYQVNISLVLRPNLSHISELLRIYTTRHLHCTLRFSFFCSTMLTWSHSGPLFPPIIIYKHKQVIWKFWRWEEEPKGRFQNLHIEPFKQFEGSRTLSNFIEPLLPKKRTEQPWLQVCV